MTETRDVVSSVFAADGAAAPQRFWLSALLTTNINTDKASVDAILHVLCHSHARAVGCALTHLGGIDRPEVGRIS